MGVDFSLHHPFTDEIVRLTDPLIHEGSTYVIGGSDVAEVSLTYNYAETIALAFEAKVGRKFPGMASWLRGRFAVDTIPEMEAIRSVLPDEPSDAGYWAATPGNAGHAVALLLRMARQRPSAIWKAL